MRQIHIIDSHTGGEPTRLVVDGFPDLGAGSMVERRARLAREHDAWRCATVLEPRGSDVIVGALLCQPVDPQCAAGVIFFNNEGYLGMCGHGTIGLVASLAHLGRIASGTHRIETPVGQVTTTLHEDGSVSVRNVPAYRLHADVRVQVPGHGTVTGDVAWGGNWFFLCTSRVDALGLSVNTDHLEELTEFSWALKQALVAAGITGAGGAEIDHVELFVPGVSGADSRSFVLCPGKAYDRSPCGTGTSAKLACLAADGLLAPGAPWVQESVIGSRFEARYSLGSGGAVLPVITGRAHVMAEGALLIDPADEFGWGIP